MLFFRWAHKEGHLDVDPAADIPSVKPDQAAPRPAPDRVWKESLMRAHPRTMIMLRLAAEAGMRRAEVAQVHTRDLLEGFDGYQLLVHGKGGKERIVPISDDLAALILAGPAGHTPEMAAFGAEGFLFPGDEDGHLSARWVGKLCANAMPQGWTMHTLRHRFATRAFRGSRNIRAVQKLLGHSNVAVTERYTAVDDAEVRAAMMAAASDSPNGHAAVRYLNSGMATAVTAAAALVFAITMLLSIQSETHTDADADSVVCYSDWNEVTIEEALTAANDPHTRLELDACDGVVV
ncbi:tyrosine-type recombinase/integrase [Mycolicibacterium sp.]|uniref:tyrosine-type recombinase/integrase n=1 Tax=Mycolicibacterium sp. TaxID=2320850 RepID=UPI0037C94E15